MCMSNQWLFFGQIATIVTFIIALFATYRVLVHTKDATIELLKEGRQELERQLRQAIARGPDILVNSLRQRIHGFEEELACRTDEESQRTAVISERDTELVKARSLLARLEADLGEAREFAIEYSCPYCGAATANRSLKIKGNEEGKREIEYDEIRYHCGHARRNGTESDPCSRGEQAFWYQHRSQFWLGDPDKEIFGKPTDDSS